MCWSNPTSSQLLARRLWKTFYKIKALLRPGHQPAPSLPISSLTHTHTHYTSRNFTTLKSPKRCTRYGPPSGSQISRALLKPLSSRLLRGGHSKVVSARPQQPHSLPISPPLPPRCSLTEIIEVGRWWEVNEALPTHS